MLLLRREYRDGAEPPEIVLLHAEVTPPGGSAGPPLRFTRVVVPADPPGRRTAYLPLPEPGERVTVRYRFSTVRGGEERFSPTYEVEVPSDDAIADLYRIPEEGTGNLPPAPGRGHFRTILPLGVGERAFGPFRYGFGAMRKKPSPALCRATNLSLMEARGYASGPGAAADEFFTADRAAFLADREAALSFLPVPRVFEAFVFGPSRSGVEYCFQTVARRPDGGFGVRWRNREGGGNWRVTL